MAVQIGVEQVTYRVHIPDLNTVESLTFDANFLVSDIVLQIKCQVPEFSEEGVAKNHHLFLAGDSYKTGQWLRPTKALKEYRLATGTLLVFQSAVRGQKIKLMDGRVREFPIDESFQTSDLVKSFCKVIGIGVASDYALCIDIEEEKIIDNLNSKFSTFWLNDHQTLREQDIKTDDVIAFRRRFYNDNRRLKVEDRVATNKMFGEITEAIISGRMPITQDEASTCGAVIAQITLGDAGKKTPSTLKQFLPKEYRKKEVEKELNERYQRMVGLDDKMAKYRFLVEVSGMKHYGFKFFKVVEKIEKGRHSKDKFVYFGVNPDVIIRVNDQTKEVISRWPLSKMVRFAAAATDFSIDFGAWTQRLYKCVTMEASAVAALINEYYSGIQKCRYAFESVPDISKLFTLPSDEDADEIDDEEDKSKLAPADTRTRRKSIESTIGKHKANKADYFLKDYEAVAGPLATWIKKKDTAIHEIVRRGKALKARPALEILVDGGEWEKYAGDMDVARARFEKFEEANSKSPAPVSVSKGLHFVHDISKAWHRVFEEKNELEASLNAQIKQLEAEEVELNKTTQRWKKYKAVAGPLIQTIAKRQTELARYTDLEDELGIEEALRDANNEIAHHGMSKDLCEVEHLFRRFQDSNKTCPQPIEVEEGMHYDNDVLPGWKKLLASHDEVEVLLVARMKDMKIKGDDDLSVQEILKEYVALATPLMEWIAGEQEEMDKAPVVQHRDKMQIETALQNINIDGSWRRWSSEMRECERYFRKLKATSGADTEVFGIAKGVHFENDIKMAWKRVVETRERQHTELYQRLHELQGEEAANEKITSSWKKYESVAEPLMSWIAEKQAGISKRLVHTDASDMAAVLLNLKSEEEWKEKFAEVRHAELLFRKYQEENKKSPLPPDQECLDLDNIRKVWKRLISDRSELKQSLTSKLDQMSTSHADVEGANECWQRYAAIAKPLTKWTGKMQEGLDTCYNRADKTEAEASFQKLLEDEGWSRNFADLCNAEDLFRQFQNLNARNPRPMIVPKSLHYDDTVMTGWTKLMAEKDDLQSTLDSSSGRHRSSEKLIPPSSKKFWKPEFDQWTEQQREEYDDYSSASKAIMVDLHNTLSIARHPAELVQLPEDMNAVSDSIPETAEFIAITAAKLCGFLLNDMSERDLAGMKKLFMTFALQVSNLVMNVRILAREKEIARRAPLGLITPCIDIAKKAIMFADQLQPNVITDVDAVLAANVAVSAACFDCARLVNSYKEPVTENMAEMVRASKAVSGAILKLLDPTKAVAAVCRTSQDQTRVNNCMLVLVNSVTQHFSLVKALRWFMCEETQSILLSVGEGIKENMLALEKHCSEMASPAQMQMIEGGKEGLLEALSAFEGILNGCASGDSLLAAARTISSKCTRILANMKSVKQETRSLVESLTGFARKLKTAGDHDSTAEKLERLTPTILSCAEELSGSIELDEATSMEFATHISSVREVLNDLASSRERNL